MKILTIKNICVLGILYSSLTFASWSNNEVDQAIIDAGGKVFDYPSIDGNSVIAHTGSEILGRLKGTLPKDEYDKLYSERLNNFCRSVGFKDPVYAAIYTKYRGCGVDFANNKNGQADCYIFSSTKFNPPGKEEISVEYQPEAFSKIACTNQN